MTNWPWRTTEGVQRKRLSIVLALVTPGLVIVALLLGASSAGAETYAQVVEGSSGVAHFWPMEESSGSAFADLVGGADASISGGVTLGQSGGLAEESKAALFNGSTGTAQVEVDLSGAHQLTVEFWMKWSGYADDDALAMEFTPNFNTNPGGFLVDPDASTGAFGVGVGEGSTRNNAYFTRPSAGAWHHYAFVINTEASGAEEITPYVDGHAVSYTKTESNNGGTFANSTLYWMSRDAASLFGGGAMQDLAIYTHALSATEVLEHYETGAGGPLNTGLPVISGQATEGESLRASTGTWAGTAPITYAYQWERCDAAGSECSNIEGATGPEYEAVSSDIGSTVRVRVTATNSVASVSAGSGATPVVAAATAPVDVSGPTIVGTARDGGTVAATPGSWEGAPAPTFSYKWQTCDSHGDRCSTIDGADSARYTAESADLEGTLRVVVTATNLAGSAEAASAASEEVQSGPPAELETPSIEGSPQVGEVLVAEPGEWGGTETELSYQWQSCEGDGEGCVDILGATDSEYTPTSGELGHTLRVEVGASNSLGSVVAISPATPAVESESALFNTWTPAITGTPQVGHTLTATTGSWLGVEELGYAYQWQRCDEDGEQCSNIEGATESTYEPGSGDVGDVLRVLASASEEHGATATASAASAPIASALAPVSTASPRGTGSPLVGETLTSSSGEWSGGTGSLTYTHQWQRCTRYGGECTSISGATSPEYSPASSDAGSTIRVRVAATDADGHSSSATSTTLLISARALANVAAPSLSGPHQLGRPLTVTTGLWTGAGPIEYAYRWQRCSEAESCNDVESATNPDYTPSEADVGHILQAQVKANSGSESQSTDSSPTPAVAADPIAPENEALPSIEGDTSVGDILSAQVGKWLSSETIEYHYQWQRCSEEGDSCTDIEGANEATHTLSEEDAGSALRINVTASNALGSSEVSSEVTEAVATPGPPANTETPGIIGAAMEGSQLATDNGTWTGTRPLHFLYQWQKCNTEGTECADMEGATAATFTPTSTEVGSTLLVRITASNALGTTTVTTPSTEVVMSREGASATRAIEIAEETDPSILATAETASAEEQTITPAVTDTGEELNTGGTLTSTDISKDTAGELALNTAGGEISVTPLETGPNANTMPTVANNTASVFAGTFPETDTIVRPDALGATTLLQLRSAQAPTTFTWEIGLGVDQELEELPDGSVAVVETDAASLEEPIPIENGSAPETENPDVEEEGQSETRAEEDLENTIAEEGPLESLAAAPHITTPSFSPTPTEPHPQDTATQYEHDSNALTYAEDHATATVLMVIPTPTVTDAEGHTIAAHLSLTGDSTVTLTINAEEETPYPVIAQASVVASSDRTAATKAHTVRYGLSDQNASAFESLDPKLTSGPGHLQVHIARDVIAYNTAEHPAQYTSLIKWLKAVGSAGLRPYITLSTLGSTSHEFCNKSEPCSAPTAKRYKTLLVSLLTKLSTTRTAESHHNEEVKHSKTGTEEDVIPPVQLWGAWNEPDLNLNKETGRDPLYNKPHLAAEYWEIAQSVIHCRPCRVVAGEFAEDSEKDHVNYIETYLTHIVHDHYRRAHKPRNIGFHDYRDLVHVPESLHGYTNPSARRFVTIIKHRFGGHAHILLSEQGVELQSGREATRLTKTNARKHRQLLAAEDFLKLANASRNIDLVSYYEYKGPKGATTSHAFDSGLLDGDHKAPANLRPAYCYLVLNKHGCPAKTATAGSVPDLTTTSSSSLLATVEPNGLPTKYRIEWGTTPAYGHTTSTSEASQTEGAESEAIPLSGLRACTTYHYQALAENEANEGTPDPGGDETFETKCEPGLPPTITLVPSTVPEGAGFEGDPDTIVKVNAHGLETFVEEFNSLGTAGPSLYPAAWETTLPAEAIEEQVGIVEPQCVFPYFGEPLVAAKKFVATNAAGSTESGWIETHWIYCYIV